MRLSTSGTTHTQLRFMSHDVVFVELFVVQTFYGLGLAAAGAGRWEEWEAVCELLLGGGWLLGAGLGDCFQADSKEIILAARHKSLR